MDFNICKERGCFALNMTKTKTGFMYRCYATPRNQTIRNVKQCEKEKTNPLDIYTPKLF